VGAITIEEYCIISVVVIVFISCWVKVIVALGLCALVLLTQRSGMWKMAAKLLVIL